MGLWSPEWEILVMYLRGLDGDYWLRKSQSGDNFKCLKCSFVSLLKSQCPECAGMFIGPHLCSWERQHSWCHPDIIQYRTSCFLLDKSHLHFVDLCSKFYLVGILVWVYMFPTVLTVLIHMWCYPWEAFTYRSVSQPHSWEPVSWSLAI